MKAWRTKWQRRRLIAGRTLAVLAVLAVSAFVAAGCGASIPSGAFCTVNGTALPIKGSGDSFNAIVNQTLNNYKQQKQPVPKKGSAQYKTISNQAVDYLIQNELMAQQADKLGIKVTDKDIQKDLNGLIKSYFQGNKKAYQKQLKAEHITDADVHQRLRDQLISEKLYNKVTKNVKISDADARAYYNNNPDSFQQKESRTVAHILVKSKAQAEKIYQQVKNGNQKTFAKLAKKYSIDSGSAKNGGVLPITKGQTVPPFDKVAFSLKTGATSKPVHSQFGWHVIQARTDIVPAKQQKFSAVKSQIVQTLQQKQAGSEYTAFRTKMRKNAEKHVDCKKGYTWTQTVKSVTTGANQPPVTTESTTSSTTGTTTTGTTTTGKTATTTSTAASTAKSKSKTTGSKGAGSSKK